MALDPGGGGAGGAPPVPRPSGNLLNWIVDLGNTPTITTPNYDQLLEQYMAPFRALYEAQINALAGNISRQQEYAKKQEALGLSNLTQQHQINDQNITQSLIARGLGDSGEPTYQHGNENKSFSNAKGSMQNQLSNTLAQLQSQLDAAKFSGLMGLQQQQLALLPFLQQQFQPSVSYPNALPFQQQPGATGSPVGPTPPRGIPSFSSFGY